MDRKGKISTRGAREYKQDVYKSLDELVVERKIAKPATSTSRNNIQSSEDHLTRAKRTPISFNFQKNEDVLKSWSQSRNQAAKKTMDPMQSSLDEVILARAVDKDKEEPSRPPKRSRFSSAPEHGDEWHTNEQMVDDEPDPIPIKLQHHWPAGLTPFRALGYLAGKGMIINMHMGKLILLEGEDPKKVQDRVWRCVITCGNIEGMADSSRQMIAREMASQVFLAKLRAEFPAAEVPKYKLPTEYFITPKVIYWVKRLVFEQKLELKKFEETTYSPERRDIDGCYFRNVVELTIGGNVFQGVSSLAKYAELEAARKLWESFTGGKLPYLRFFLDDRCDRQRRYEFSQTEVSSLLPGDFELENKIAETGHQLNFILDPDDKNDNPYSMESFTAMVERDATRQERLEMAKLGEQRLKKGGRPIYV